MRYAAMTLILSLLSLLIGQIVWATDDGAFEFFALRDVRSPPRDGRNPRALSDAQLAAVEGSAWFPRLSLQVRNQELRELMYQLVAQRLLGQLLAGNGSMSIGGQSNILIQVNIAIGNNITQSNNALQWNSASIGQRVR